MIASKIKLPHLSTPAVERRLFWIHHSWLDTETWQVGITAYAIRHAKPLQDTSGYCHVLGRVDEGEVIQCSGFLIVKKNLRVHIHLASPVNGTVLSHKPLWRQQTTADALSRKPMAIVCPLESSFKHLMTREQYVRFCRWLE